MKPEDKLAEDVFAQYIGNDTYRMNIKKKHIIEAMQAYHEAKLKEELISFCNYLWTDNNDAKLVDEYLKQREK